MAVGGRFAGRMNKLAAATIAAGEEIPQRLQRVQAVQRTG